MLSSPNDRRIIIESSACNGIPAQNNDVRGIYASNEAFYECSLANVLRPMHVDPSCAETFCVDILDATILNESN